jgi:hypothetical protein
MADGGSRANEASRYPVHYSRISDSAADQIRCTIVEQAQQRSRFDMPDDRNDPARTRTETQAAYRAEVVKTLRLDREADKETFTKIGKKRRLKEPLNKPKAEGPKPPF